MSKLADIFRPRGYGADDDGVVVPMPLPATRTDGAGVLANGGWAAPDAADPVPAVELHRSEENEALHRLLVDTRRKIDDLDHLKSALDDMVLPFRGAMRALDQERVLSANLSRQLSEKAAANDKLCDELQHAETKSRLLEAEAENLRDAVDQAREFGYASESARALLGDEIKRRDAKIAALERQLDQEALQRRNLAETYHALQEQALHAEKRIAEMQAALVEAGEKIEALKQDKRSLWHSAEQAREQSERMTRRVADGEGALSAIRGELGKVETRYAEICAERNRLADAVDELRAQQLAESQGFDRQQEALQARVAAAERQVAEMRQRLIERTEEARSFICKAAEATIARATAERRLAALQVSQGLRGADKDESDEARTALSEYLRALNLKSREMALAGGAEKMAALSERPGQPAAAQRPPDAGADKRADGPVAGSRGNHVQRPDITKVLDDARSANVRLESEAASLGAGLLAGPGTAERFIPEAFETGLPINRSGTVRAGRLGYEAGLVAQLRRPLEEDDPGRSVA